MKEETAHSHETRVTLGAAGARPPAESEDNAPWDIAGVTLQDMRRVLKKTVPPNEFSTKSIIVLGQQPEGSDAESVMPLFRWASNENPACRWDMSRKDHKLFLLQAVLFSRCGPFVGKRARLALVATTAGARDEEIGLSPWVDGESGVKKTLPLLFSMAAQMLLHYEEDSPLLRLFRFPSKSAERKKYTKWTDKMGAYSAQVYFPKN